MFFRSTDLDRGGLRLFVARDQSYPEKMLQLREQHSADQTAAGLSPNAHDNWLVVQPHDIA